MIPKFPSTLAHLLGPPGTPRSLPPRLWFRQQTACTHYFPQEFRGAVRGLRCCGSQGHRSLKRNYTLTQRMGLSTGAFASWWRGPEVRARPGACGACCTRHTEGVPQALGLLTPALPRHSHI